MNFIVLYIIYNITYDKIYYKYQIDNYKYQNMEYINVSQFYESILCFSIPLLIIQRFILIRYDLSIKYEDYRRTFY